jgi:flagellar FliL protein
VGAVRVGMSAAPAKAEESGSVAVKGGRKKLVLLAVPVLLGAIGAGLWFGGILPPLLGMGHAQASKTAEVKPADVKPPSFVEVPELVANLDAGPRRTSYVKLHSRLELARPEDAALVQADMPRLLDMFQTYLREMRPDELRGSAGSYRLREELIASANIAVQPARVVDVLFTEMLIQ